ncbi:MAG TPA: NAD(P)-dependent oxidoreductase [Candidatus Acidoferrum sp.]|nr:NAD(P)-dependent oxidoreductase [Candidatus Acidoferrum sp.]
MQNDRTLARATVPVHLRKHRRSPVKVLVADPFEVSGLEGLAAAGCDVVFDPALKDEALEAALGTSHAEVLVVRSTRVTAAMMDAGELALIVRAGAGYNTIDVAAASARGIYVSNCPGKNSIAVAELVFGLVLSLDRRIPDNVVDLRAGHWNKAEYSKARGLHGRTLGLLGFGNIAQEVARRAQSFGMDVAIWSRRFADGEDADLTTYGLDTARGSTARVMKTPAEVAAVADVLSVHVALGPETRGLVDPALLAALRPGALFINTSRAEVVDHVALADAVRDRGIRVGLDVYPDEPTGGTAEFAPAIVALPGVYGTHHIGASTEQAQEAIAAETVRIVRSFKDTGRVPNVVNLARRTPATHLLVVRHRNRPGVLAHVFDHLRAEGINVLETENVIFEDAEAAIARINMDGTLTPAQLEALETGNANIISLQLVAL